ncbi:MAG: hypothetical protein SGARI_004476, partial [Bacillariaceae sp.]
MWGNNSNNNNNKEPEEPKKDDDKDGGILDKFSANLEELKEDIANKLTAILPAPMVEFLTNMVTKLKELLPNIKIAVLSFFAGGVIMLSAILVPVYSSVEQLSQPVTLFETILADLDAGYVDPVDTNKLFETGVSAMLRSLDPYTEFEAREEAQVLNEGIMGKYGGVGLVIAGVTPKDVAEMKKISSPTSTTTTPIQQQPQDSKLLPQDAIEDSMDMDAGTDVSSSSSSSSMKQQQKSGAKTRFITADDDDLDPDDEEEREVMAKKNEQAKAIAKAQSKGIRVVTAFEGYAYDYGMRVGDRLKQVDDLLVTTETSVDDVRNILR